MDAANEKIELRMVFDSRGLNETDCGLVVVSPCPDYSAHARVYNARR